jgi:hypothetical protein
MNAVTEEAARLSAGRVMARRFPASTGTAAVNQSTAPQSRLRWGGRVTSGAVSAVQEASCPQPGCWGSPAQTLA